MAKNTQPIVKRCRALGISPAAMGYTGKTKRESNRNPKGQMRRKQSEFWKSSSVSTMRRPARPPVRPARSC